MAMASQGTMSYPPSLAASTTKMIGSDAKEVSEQPQWKADRRFSLVFLAVCAVTFLTALDFSSVGTIVPTISKHFESGDGSWFASAYALASTALVPWMSSLANIFGRKASLATSVVVFALGSLITALATSMKMAIGGRAVQGAGGAGLLCLAQIVVVDLVPLAKRGLYIGLLSAVWSVASTVGPCIAGALGSAGAWRWLWYLNLPACAVCFVLCVLFLDFKTPNYTWRQKWGLMNWNNATFVAAATAIIIALTYGGTKFPWRSWHVLVPLCLGGAGMVVFLVVEKVWIKDPTVPFDVLSERNAFLGYLSILGTNCALLAIVYYLPIFFQAVQGSSPLRSGVQIFSLSATVAPTAAFAGVTVRKTGKYRLLNIAGHAFACTGFAVMTKLLDWDAPPAIWIAFPVLVGAGSGLLLGACNFPCLAGVSVQQQTYAMAFLTFIRQFGGVIGISIGASVLQNGLAKSLPLELVSQFHGSTEIAWAAIPVIKTLPEPLRTTVKEAFADALKRLWLVCAVITGACFLLCCLMKDVPLHQTTDERWGMAGSQSSGINDDMEKQLVTNKANDVKPTISLQPSPSLQPLPTSSFTSIQIDEEMHKISDERDDIEQISTAGQGEIVKPEEIDRDPTPVAHVDDNASSMTRSPTAPSFETALGAESAAASPTDVKASAHSFASDATRDPDQQVSLDGTVTQDAKLMALSKARSDKSASIYSRSAGSDEEDAGDDDEKTRVNDISGAAEGSQDDPKAIKDVESTG